MKITALYEQVTNSIITDLERGAVPWVKPWKATGNSLIPLNAATRRQYNGINIPILWEAAERNAYPKNEWLTFKQALEKGAVVRRGEKSTHVVFVKKIHPKDDEERLIGMLKAYSVFNVSQVDGLAQPDPPTIVSEVERHQDIETFIQATKAEVKHGGDMAAYIPSRDYITMPEAHTFKGMEHYYATVLHELTHWTGAKHRLDRDLSGRFKTASYAAEELVAELGAAFLCAHLGIQGELRHSGYIGNWLQLLKEDSRAIFTASSKASQAADYLRGFGEQAQEEVCHDEAA